MLLLVFCVVMQVVTVLFFVCNKIERQFSASTFHTAVVQFHCELNSLIVSDFLNPNLGSGLVLSELGTCLRFSVVWFHLQDWREIAVVA